jgi:hypothetical protein
MDQFCPVVLSRHHRVIGLYGHRVSSLKSSASSITRPLSSRSSDFLLAPQKVLKVISTLPHSKMRRNDFVSDSIPPGRSGSGRALRFYGSTLGGSIGSTGIEAQCSDSGQTWAELPLSGGSVQTVAINNTPGVLYAATASAVCADGTSQVTDLYKSVRRRECMGGSSTTGGMA